MADLVQNSTDCDDDISFFSYKTGGCGHDFSLAVYIILGIVCLCFLLKIYLTLCRPWKDIKPQLLKRYWKFEEENDVELQGL